VDAALERTDIRSDPASGIVREGLPLALVFSLAQVSSGSCTPLPGAVVDVWHCDALGVYSGVSDPGFDTSEQAFLRGYQVTDESGTARFQTIYPGWYSGRAVHIHFKIRTAPGSEEGYEFTSQLFFDEELNDAAHSQEPYAQKGMRNTLNSTDNIFSEQLVLDAQEAAEGYTANFAVALDLSDSVTGQPDGRGGGPPRRG
jgi:protocatechuate 3,4-dioxygenase beta subunit